MRETLRPAVYGSPAAGRIYGVTRFGHNFARFAGSRTANRQETVGT